MPNLYARATALPDLIGRLDYISSDSRQEALLAVYDGAENLLAGQYWKILAAESEAAFEQFGQKERKVVDPQTGEVTFKKQKVCQGRELVLQLSNSTLPYKDGSFDKKKAAEIVKTAAEAVSEWTGQPVKAGLHYNKAKNNLHVHMVFPERSLLDEPVIKVAERNLFFDEEGKRRYKKSEILDENKELRPGCRIVKKGEIYEQRYFGSVDPKYSSQAWMKDLKTNCLLVLRNGKLKGDVLVTEFDYSTGKLPQQKVGVKDKYRKNPETPERIRAYNRLVRQYNDLIDRGDIDLEAALEIQRDILGSRRRNEPLQQALDLLRKKVKEAEAEKKKRAQEHRNWAKYQGIRDDTWSIYLSAQRVEMAAIRGYSAEMRELFEKHSTPIYDGGKVVGYRMQNPLSLEISGYYRKMENLELEMSQHRQRLNMIRDLEDISRGRQKIMRALILAGAEQSVIDSAMREYEEASRVLQLHAQSPHLEVNGGRLAAAQTSLELAQKRAQHYIDKLTEEQLNEPEKCEIMEQTDLEYQAFQENEWAQVEALQAEMAAAAAAPEGRAPALTDLIGNADSRSGSGSRTKSREEELNLD